MNGGLLTSYNPEHQHGVHAQMAEVVTEGEHDEDWPLDSCPGFFKTPHIFLETMHQMESITITKSCWDDEESKTVSEF